MPPKITSVLLPLWIVALVFLPAIDTHGEVPPSTSARPPDHLYASRLAYLHRLLPAETRGQIGQGAVGAIQEVVAALLADPTTDWSEVNIERLRQHLVDMDEVMLRAEVEERPIEGGLEMVVGGSEKTVTALQRVVPAHADRIAGFRDWRFEVREVEEKIIVRVESEDAGEVEVIRALGFFGLLASGVHHQDVHLALALGR